MRPNKIVWGIIFILAAVGILLVAFVPELQLLGVATWKWFVGALLLFWLLKNLIFGWDLSEHLDIFIPIALLMFVFEKDIAKLLTLKTDNIYNNWLIAGAAILLTIAVKLLFKNKGATKHSSRTFRFSDAVTYLDFSNDKEYSVRNKLGETNVYCQNIDGANGLSFTLHVDNSLGELNIHVPDTCDVVVNVHNSLGEVNTRANGTLNVKTINIVGTNKLGEINIVSL